MSNVFSTFTVTFSLFALGASAPADEYPEPGSYQATPSDYERVANLGCFFGSWNGTVVPVYDPKGAWRDTTEGFEINIVLEKDIAQVRFRMADEWVTVTSEDSRADFVDSALVISDVFVSNQSHAYSFVLHRSSADIARAWVLLTGGNPYLPHEHIWANYGALAVGEIRREE